MDAEKQAKIQDLEKEIKQKNNELIKLKNTKTFNSKKISDLQYDINGRSWFTRDINGEYQIWTSQWWCGDGDEAVLYVDKGGFELGCFSGIPASKIYIDVVDFGVMWNKAFGELVDEVEPIQTYTHTQQCIMLADWLCSIFCEWTDTSNYKLKDNI